MHSLICITRLVHLTEQEYRQAFYTFILGVLAIHFAAVFFVWLAFPEILKAGVLTVCLFVSLVLLYRYIYIYMCVCASACVRE